MKLVKLSCGTDRNIVYVNPMHVLDVCDEGDSTMIRLAVGFSEISIEVISSELNGLTFEGATAWVQVWEPVEQVAELISAELDSPRRWQSNNG